MKIMCTRRDLHDGLAAAGRVTSKTPLPILANTLIRTAQGGLEIIGNDHEIGIRRSIPAQVQEEGSFTTSSRILTELVNALPDSHVQIAAVVGEPVKVTCERSVFDLITLPTEDYPAWPEVGPGRELTLKTDTLRTMVQQVAFAASNDESRTVMTGINLVFKDGALTMAATDGHRLAVRRLPCDGLDFEAAAIVPARALNEVARLLPTDEESNVVIRLDDRQIEFSALNTVIISRLIEGQYPNFERVVPANTDKALIMQTQELSQAVRRAAIVVRETNKRVVFKTEGDRVVLTAVSGDVGTAREEVEALREGEDIQIAFNAQYLQDVLGVLGSEGVRIELTGQLNPGLVKPTDGDDYLYVIMPMQIV